MKTIFSIIVLLLLSTILVAQKKSKKQQPELKSCSGVALIKQIQVGDSVILCNTCRMDACGNVINTNADTVFRNRGGVHPDFKPLYLTDDTVLLTKKDVQVLFDKNKIAQMHFLHCNDVASKMGFIALEGMYLIHLKDTAIVTIPLRDAVRKQFNSSVITAAQILINGYHLFADKIKFPVHSSVDIKYLEKDRLYCVLTE